MSEPKSNTFSYPKNSGWLGLYNAGRFSIKGIRYCLKHEAGIRLFAVIFILSMPVVFLLGESLVERVILLGAALLVIVLELLNSAIEATLDRISTEHHPLTGAAKDMGSAAVFSAVLFLIYVWGEFIYRAIQG